VAEHLTAAVQRHGDQPGSQEFASGVTPEDKRRLLNHYDEHAGHSGTGAISHASAHVAYVADTVTEARDALRAAMPGWLATTGQYVRIDASPGPNRDPHAYLQHLLDIHPVGPPQLCVQRLADTMAATAARRLLLMVEGAGDPRQTLSNIARLGAEARQRHRLTIDEVVGGPWLRPGGPGTR
jgi:hypothetical protein